MSGVARGAVMDIGSNSVRIMVVEIGPEAQWRVLDEQRALLRLGAVLARDGRLMGVVAKAQAVVSALAERARYFGAHTIVAVATAAVREAIDGADFCAALQAAAGVDIRVLSGQDEARLGFVGALNALSLQDGNVVDIGGASTEISCFEKRQWLRCASVPIGAVTLGELHPQLQGLPSAAALARAQDEVKAALQNTLFAPAVGVPLVVLGGSFRSIAKMHRATEAAPESSLHGYRLPPAAISDLLKTLAKLTPAQRLKVSGLARHRADLVLAALTMAGSVVDVLRPSEIVVSGTGLREGLLHVHLLGEGDAVRANVLRPSIDNLLFQLGSDGDEALVRTTTSLWMALSAELSVTMLHLGEQACRLRGIGARINFYDRHRHTFGIVTGARLFGLTQREQVLLAAIAAYEGPRHTRQLLRPYRSVLESADTEQVQRLGLALALAEALRCLAPDRHLRFATKVSASSITLSVSELKAPPRLPFGDLERLADQFAKVYGKELRLCYRAN